MKTDIYTSWENHVIGGCALNHGLKKVRARGKGPCAKVWDVRARWLCTVRDNNSIEMHDEWWQQEHCSLNKHIHSPCHHLCLHLPVSWWGIPAGRTCGEQHHEKNWYNTWNWLLWPHPQWMTSIKWQRMHTQCCTQTIYPCWMCIWASLQKPRDILLYNSVSYNANVLQRLTVLHFVPYQDGIV